MCYERILFESWAKQKVQKREQIKPEVESARPDVQPMYPASEREITRRKEVKREFEEIV